MLEFKSILDFPRGTLYQQLKDAYSFDKRYEEQFDCSWQEYDSFFYNHESIAKTYGFVTVLNGIPIGHITYNPRNLPEKVILGHNCILSSYKKNGYGKQQLEEAIRRIKLLHPQKIVVTTNQNLIPAIHNYESVGFTLVKKRENKDTFFSGNYLDYEITI